MSAFQPDLVGNDALLSRFEAWSRDLSSGHVTPPMPKCRNPIGNLKCLHEFHRHFCGLPGLVEVDDEVH